MMHQFDSRTKILIVVCLSTIAMIITSPWILTGVLLGMIVLMLLMGISISRMKKQMLTIIGMIIFVFVLQAIFGQWQLGLLLAVRLLILLLSALILLTGEPRDYLLAFVQMHMPYELAYMVILAFHFFPLLREEALDIYYSMQLRGTEIEKAGWTKKLGIYRKMCIPILAGALGRAKDTSIAMEARGFRAKGKRTYMRRLKLRMRDVVFMIITVCLSGGIVAFAWAYDGPSPADLISGKTTEFMVIGDVQYTLRDRDYGIWGDMIEDAYAQNPRSDFALFTGDMVNNPADEKDWKAFFLNEKRALGDLPIYTTPGNHETAVTPRAYLTKFKLPENGPVSSEFYSFDAGNCHIVSLNSCFFMDERKGEPNYEADRRLINKWLENDLKKADNRANAGSNSDETWTIVFMHHPMYPIVEDVDLYEQLRDNWEQIFIDNGVDVVFCGHQHCYMRTEPLGANGTVRSRVDNSATNSSKTKGSSSDNTTGDNASKNSESSISDGITYVMSNSGQKPSYYVDEGTRLPDYVEECSEGYSGYVVVKAWSNTLKIYAYNDDGKKVDVFKTDKNDRK